MRRAAPFLLVLPLLAGCAVSDEGYPILRGEPTAGIATPWGPIMFGTAASNPSMVEHEYCHIRRAEIMHWPTYYARYLSDPDWACSEELICNWPGHPACNASVTSNFIQVLQSDTQTILVTYLSLDPLGQIYDGQSTTHIIHLEYNQRLPIAQLHANTDQFWIHSRLTDLAGEAYVESHINNLKYNFGWRHFLLEPQLGWSIWAIEIGLPDQPATDRLAFLIYRKEDWEP